MGLISGGLPHREQHSSLLLLFAHHPRVQNKQKSFRAPYLFSLSSLDLCRFNPACLLLVNKEILCQLSPTTSCCEAVGNQSFWEPFSHQRVVQGLIKWPSYPAAYWWPNDRELMNANLIFPRIVLILPVSCSYGAAAPCSCSGPCRATKDGKDGNLLGSLYMGLRLYKYIYIAYQGGYLLKIASLKCVALFPRYELLWWLLYTCGLQNCPINPPHKCYRYNIIFTESQNKVSAIARAQLPLSHPPPSFSSLSLFFFFLHSQIVLPRTWSPDWTKLQLLYGCCLRLSDLMLKLHTKEIQICASPLLLSLDEHPESPAALPGCHSILSTSCIS